MKNKKKLISKIIFIALAALIEIILVFVINQSITENDLLN